MKLHILFIVALLTLCILCGCENQISSTDPAWLPVDADYLRRQVAIFEGTLDNGKMTSCTISFPLGGGLFKSAIFDSETNTLTYTDGTFSDYEELSVGQLPTVVSSINLWLSDTPTYCLSFRPMDSDAQATFDFSAPTAICDLSDAQVHILNASYTGKWRYGVMDVFTADGNSLLWQIILEP